MLYNVLNNNTERISENRYTNYEIETAFSQKKLNNVDHKILLDIEEYSFVCKSDAWIYAQDNDVDFEEVLHVGDTYYLQAE